jgi:hypothetical protein
MDKMIIPAAATPEGPTQAAVTEGDPEAEVVREVEEVAGMLQRPRDQMRDGLAMLELHVQPAQQIALRCAELNPATPRSRRAQRKEGQRRNNAQFAMRGRPT